MPVKGKGHEEKPVTCAGCSEVYCAGCHSYGCPKCNEVHYIKIEEEKT